MSEIQKELYDLLQFIIKRDFPDLGKFNCGRVFVSATIIGKNQDGRTYNIHRFRMSHDCHMNFEAVLYFDIVNNALDKFDKIWKSLMLNIEEKK